MMGLIVWLSCGLLGVYIMYRVSIEDEDEVTVSDIVLGLIIVALGTAGLVIVVAMLLYDYKDKVVFKITKK